jgi:sigma-B regulation protein RsbU (phosphoserine phosphatase)
MEQKGGWFQIASITAKIIAVNLLILLICTVGLGIFNFTTFQNEIVDICADNASDIAGTVAQFIDGDNLVKTLASGEKNPTWLHENELLTNILELTGLTYLYIISSDYDEYVTYYLSSDDDIGYKEHVNNYPPEAFQTIKTGVLSNTSVYNSANYGKMVSGFAAVHDSNGNIVGVVGADMLLDDLFSTNRVLEFMHHQFITLLLYGTILILLQMFLFRRMIGRPIKELTVASAKIGSGDLDVSLSIHTGDEMEDLSKTFTKMTVQLKDYIANLTEITAEKERIGAELNIARRIQASMLPSVSSLSPHHAEFDIYAMMQPAKEVAGDFYDFFMVNDRTLAVLIADVSGKGIASALFMVISKTLIKNNAQSGKSPKEVFETVNNMLYENNDADMFVTTFLGYLDIPSGKFTFVNAGHNPPLLRSNKHFDWLEAKSGFVLAGMEDMLYEQREITLQPGNELFLYTDGVTEAKNYENKFFSSLRLFETINKYHDLPLKEITVSIMHEIDQFSKGIEQTDDITMLVLRYHGFEDGARVY